jgi:hypothetical protein
MTDVEDLLLTCMVAVVDDEAMVRDMFTAYREGDETARCVDRMLCELIEAGLISPEATWGKEAWNDAVDRMYPEPDDD